MEIFRLSEGEELVVVEADPEQAQIRFRWLYFRDGDVSCYVTSGDCYASLTRYDSQSVTVES